MPYIAIFIILYSISSFFAYHVIKMCSVNIAILAFTTLMHYIQYNTSILSWHSKIHIYHKEKLKKRGRILHQHQHKYITYIRYIDQSVKREQLYMVIPKSPKRSPKLILRTPLATAFWKTPTGKKCTCHYKQQKDTLKRRKSKSKASCKTCQSLCYSFFIRSWWKKPEVFVKKQAK